MFSYKTCHKQVYHNDPKFLNNQVVVNSVDLDQTALEGLMKEQSDHGLHCLSFCLYL